MTGVRRFAIEKLQRRRSPDATTGVCRLIKPRGPSLLC
jgi:hypothetical protein